VSLIRVVIDRFASGTNNSELTIPAIAVGYYIHVDRQHKSLEEGTTRYNKDVKNVVGPIQAAD
jgi:hypothetical protein